MADLDWEKLQSLRNQARSGEISEFPTESTEIPLEPNVEVQFTYHDGHPFRLVLTPGVPIDKEIALEVGHVEDLSIANPRNYNVDFVIVDKPLLGLGKGLMGLKGLSSGETVVIGRESLEDRFSFLDEISNKHVQVRREKTGKDELIFFKDLGSTLGTVVVVKGPHSEYSKG